jgi:hypothetical protein
MYVHIIHAYKLLFLTVSHKLLYSVMVSHRTLYRSVILRDIILRRQCDRAHTKVLPFFRLLLWVVQTSTVFPPSYRQTLTLTFAKVHGQPLKSLYSSAPVSAGNAFQDLPRLLETADNTERYIQRDIT